MLPVVLTDRGGTRTDRARRCLVALLAAATGSYVGAAGGDGAWKTGLVVVAVAIVSGAISWLGPLASVAALDLLVFTCISSGGSLGSPTWHAPLLILAGGVATLALLLTGSFPPDSSWAHPPPDLRRMGAAAVQARRVHGDRRRRSRTCGACSVATGSP